MEISTALVHRSLAAVCAATTPDAHIYDNPNQQGTKLPCWFIVHREPVSIIRENQRRAWLVYAVDLYHMRELNTPRLFDEYSAVGDALDSVLTYLPVYGTTDTLLHVYERSWELAMNCLKYSLTLRVRCAPDLPPPSMMETLTMDVFLKSIPRIVSVRFVSAIPAFEMPQTLYVYAGHPFVLPTVSGEYPDGHATYTPSGWTLGPFGESVSVSESSFCELVFAVTPIENATELQNA